MNTIKIQQSNGKYDAKKAKKLFSYIDGDLKSYSCDSDDTATPETTVECRKLEKKGTFIDMFGTEPKSFTKAQVIDIVENHAEAMNKDGWGNFFPYQNKDGERFVLYVYFYGSEWGLYVDKLADASVWYAEDGHVLFVPQQETSALGASDTETLVPLDYSALTPIGEAIKLLKEQGYKITKERTIVEEF